MSTTSKLLLLAALMPMPFAVAAPQTPRAPMNTPLTTKQKNLHAVLMREMNRVKEPADFNYARLESLLRQGAPVNAPDKDGYPPLLLCAGINERLTALFLKYGANPNGRGQTRVLRDTYAGGTYAEKQGAPAGGARQHFSSILTTGAAWKGPIGRVRAVFDIKGCVILAR